MSPDVPGTGHDDTVAGTDETVAVRWSVGERVLDLYDVLGIHEGGMGVVYRARHRDWDVDVALKRPRGRTRPTARERERFIEEAGTWVDLGLHPHVCHCFYVRMLDDVPLVVADYVAGGSLADAVRAGRLHRGGPDEVLARILEVALHTAWGLAHAHDAGVVHRDVKPANVLLGEDGTARVTDFGLAGTFRGLAGHPEADGPRPGTPRYASPEQAAGGAPGPPSDVWSLGATLLATVIGRATWMTGPAAGEALRHARPAPPLTGLPPALAEVLHRCLRWDPDDRPASAADVVPLLLEAAGTSAAARPRPRPARPRADELNNRALSLLDLGRDAEAHRLFDEALADDPRHPEAVYNAGLLRWRGGRATDDTVLDDLRAARRGATADVAARVDRLVALVDDERGAGGGTGAVDLPTDDTLGALGGPGFAVTPDGRRLLLGRATGGIDVHALPGGEPVGRLRGGHSTRVVGIVPSADGRGAVSADDDGRVCRWDLESGRFRVVRRGRGGPRVTLVSALGPSTGCAAVIADDARSVRVARTGRWRERVLPAGTYATVTALTPDEQVLLVGESDGGVRVWDLVSGRRLTTLRGHVGPVEDIAVDPTGRTAVTAAGGFDDLSARVWDVRAGLCGHVLVGHAGPLTSVRITPDGGRAVTASGDGTLRVWDLDTGTCIRVLDSGTRRVPRITDVVAGPPATAVVDEVTGAVRLWDLDTGRCRRTPLHGADRDGVFAAPIRLTGDGRVLVAAAKHRARIMPLAPIRTSPLVICRSRTPDELTVAAARARRLLAGARDLGDADPTAAARAIEELRALPGHRRDRDAMATRRAIARGGRRGEYRGAWLRDTLTVGSGTVTALCALPDRPAVLVACDDGSPVRLWDPDAGSPSMELGDGHAVAVTPDGRVAITAGVDGAARVWDLVGGQRIATLTGHRAGISAVTATPDGSRVITATDDGTAAVWDLGSGEMTALLTGHRSGITAVAATADGAVLTAGADGTVRRWDAVTGRWTGLVESFVDGGPIVMRLAGSGRLVSAPSRSGGGVRVRDLADDRCVHDGLGRGPTFVSAIGVSPDGRHAAVTCHDPRIRLWDLTAGRQLDELVGEVPEVTALDATPGWDTLFTGGPDGGVQVWEVDWTLDEPTPVTGADR